MAAMQRRVLMVALDGLDIGLLQRAFEAGRLPNLKAFAEASQEVAVHSDGERLEGTVWPTFTTGTGPGTHGHHWFYLWVPEEARFVAASDERFAVKPFWAQALEARRRVIEFDLPYAPVVGHPNERAFNGWGLQDEMTAVASPPGFRKEVVRKHGKSRVHKDTLLVRTPEDRLGLARRLRGGARQRSRVLLDLVQRRDWELLIFGFGEFHLGGHHLALPMDLSPKVTNETAMYSILRPVDDAWPEIVAAAGDDCDIFLFALHGMRPKVSYAEGAHRMLQEMEGRPQPPAPKADIFRRLRDLLPQRVHQAIWLRLPEDVRMERMISAWMSRMDLEHDRAFVFEGDCAVAIRLNIAGREKHGILPRDRAQEFFAEIQREANRYTTEEGKRPFTDLVLSTDVYSGPRLDLLPDAMLLYNPEVVRTRRLIRDDGFELNLQGPESRNGIHTGRGFAFYRSGDGARLRDRDMNNLDFAPTVLDRLGVTPGGALEGASLLS